jgi:hypothetical protein
MERIGNRSRPMGVIVIAIVLLLGVVVNFAAAADLLGFAGARTVAERGAIAVPVGWLLVIAGVLSIPAAYGVFAMTSWGWALAVGLNVMAFVQNALMYLNDASVLVAMVVTAIVPALILWYLFRPHIRAAFGRAG